MKKLEFTHAFKRDVRKLQKRQLEKLSYILKCLQVESELPSNSFPHLLTGNYTGWCECHVMPDLLLVYAEYEDVVLLKRVASHSQLFS